MHLFQMLVLEHISTRITGVNDNNSSNVIICKSFNRIKVYLPVSFRDKIEMENLKMIESRTSFVLWVTRDRQQNVGTRKPELILQFQLLVYS